MATSIVPELLKIGKNYKNWRSCMKSYLISQDLWEVVDDQTPTPEEIEDFRKKDAAVLHAIKISCSPYTLTKIRKITSAKAAWSILAKYGKKWESDSESESEFESEYELELEREPEVRSPVLMSSAAPSVVEPLNGKNYKIWRACMESYLESQDLWGVVCWPEGNEEVDEAFKMMDAIALHAIQVSCSPDILAKITKIKGANQAWKKLSREHNPDHEEVIFSEEGDKEVERTQVLTLFNAIKENNLDSIKDLLGKNLDLINAKLFKNGTNALQLAIIYNQLGVVQELLPRMSVFDMVKSVNSSAMSSAVSFGTKEIVEFIVSWHDGTLLRFNAANTLKAACVGGDKDMIYHLYPQLKTNITTHFKATYVIQWMVYNMKMFDLALDLLDRHPKAIFGILDLLDLEPELFICKRLLFWQQWIYSCLPQVNLPKYASSSGDVGNQEQLGGLWLLLKVPGIKQIYDLKFTHVCVRKLLLLLSKAVTKLENGQFYYSRVHEALFKAAKLGAAEIIKELIRENPDMLWWTDDDGRNIFHIAILNRQEKVFSLIYRIGALKDRILLSQDKTKCSMLHMAGESPPQCLHDQIQGPALLMQRELQWFQEVQNLVPGSVRKLPNFRKQNAYQVFEENHKELVEQGQKWMNKIAQSSTVVGTLIITIMFAALFTVPGGSNQDTVIPLFLAKRAFKVFVISDAISLSASSTSVLIFLNLLTCRYAPNDFLRSLPTKLIIALFSLFISIATMMIAFSSAVFLVLKGKLSFVIPIVVLVSIPVIAFLWLQFPLQITTLWSTCVPGIFDRNGISLIDRERNRGEDSDLEQGRD